MKACSKRPQKLRALLLSLAVGSLLVWKAGALAKPPEGKGGGKSDGGGDNLTNPAFVYEKDVGLYLTTVDGQSPTRLIDTPANAADRSAAWSPDGTWIAFLRHPEADKIDADLYTVAADGTDLRFIRAFRSGDAVIPDGGQLDWSPDGSTVIFSSWKSLWAVNLSTGNLQLVFDHSSLPSPSDIVADPDFSPDFDAQTPGYQGIVAFTASTGVVEPFDDYQVDIWLLAVDIDVNGQITTGTLMNLTDSHRFEEMPAWSPDGQYLAYTAFQESGQLMDIVVVEWTTGLSWNVVTDLHSVSQPDWSSDGEELCYSAKHFPKPGGAAGTTDVFRVSAWDLTSPIVNVTQTDSGKHLEQNPRWNSVWQVQDETP